jgi:DNA replication protein DnaC
MNIECLKQQLMQLRLNAAASELEIVLKEEKKAISLNWVSSLLEREIESRKQKALAIRIKKARFPEVTAIEKFDWDFNPSINQQEIMNLASLDFIKSNGIALFLGQPGTGKTHLALAIGYIAARQGYHIYCTSVKKLSRDILMAKAKQNLDVLFKKILSCKLWILDDWGVVSMDRDVAEEVFDLLDRRKYSSALILTSNRAVNEWGEVFPDPILASAAIDRIFDRAHILKFVGESYRLKGRINAKIVDTNNCQM